MLRYLILMLLVLSTRTSDAQCYNNYCKPTYSYSYSTPRYSYSYSTPTYCPPTYSTPRYSEPVWEWRQWPTDPNYWIRVKVVGQILENDGYLYIKEGTYWSKHCPISQYQVKAVYTEPVYKTIEAYPYLNRQGVLLPSAPHHIVDPRSFLAPVDESREAFAFVDKSTTSVTDMALRIAQGEQAKELAKINARNELSKAAQAGVNDAVFMSELQKLFALRQRSAVFDSGSPIDTSQVTVSNPELAKILVTTCIGCHGPTKQEAGLDLRSLEPDSPVWADCWAEVRAGSMPKNSPKLSSEQIELFRLQAFGGK
jgi:mono/diheme cytochrome c family protein